MNDAGTDVGVTTHGSTDSAVSLVVGLDGDDRIEAVVETVLDGRAVKTGVAVVAVDGACRFDGHESDEGRRGEAVISAIGDHPAIAVTSEHRTAEPIAFFDRVSPDTLEHAAVLPTRWAVDRHRTDPGGASSRGIVVYEIGTKNPETAITELLVALGVIDGDEPSVSPAFYATVDEIRAEGNTTLEASNFELVAQLSVFGSRDGEPLVAQWPFYPVLFGESGDDDVLGYRASRVGTTVAHAKAALAPETLE